MSEQPDFAGSFGSVAAAYDRGRPGYPREAVAWLTGPEPRVLLELGAGTGKLTAVLAELGHDVHATDPSPEMLAVLEARLPRVRTAVAPAERIPLPDGSVDVVVSGQAFHWFDPRLALPEIARVLRPGGRLALVWNERDERIPWVRRLGGLIGSQDQLRDPTAAVSASGLFGPVAEAAYPFWQHVDGSILEDLTLSRSNVAVLDAAGRAAKLAEVEEFYADFARGADGMELPYRCRCFRAEVRDRLVSETITDPDAADIETLLIDFR